MNNWNNQNDPLKVIFEKILFGGEHYSREELTDAVVNYFFEYLQHSKVIIREKDIFALREEFLDEISDLINMTVGLDKNISEYLSGFDNLEEKKQEANEKFLELYIELEEKYAHI